MDPLFEFFLTGKLRREVPKENLTNLRLNPVIIDNLPDDNFSNAFQEGGNQLANIDWLFGLPKSGIYADVSKEQQGGVEYWLWKSVETIAYMEKTTGYSEFRSDLSQIDIRLFFNDQPWAQLEQIISCVGSFDVPTDILNLRKQLQIAFDILVEKGTFFFPLPDDQNVEKLLGKIKGSCQYLSVIRLITSPFPFVIGQKLTKITVPEVKVGAKTTPLEEILVKKYYNFKRFSILTKIPYSLPGQP